MIRPWEFDTVDVSLPMASDLVPITAGVFVTLLSAVMNYVKSIFHFGPLHIDYRCLVCRKIALSAMVN